jgi:TRAP-type mannitol/chloroaromatic compound transport system substrate-binding protein
MNEEQQNVITQPVEPVTEATPEPSGQTSRRRFLSGAAVTTAAGASALAFPNIAKGQVTWTMQAGWPTGDILWEYAQDYVRLVNDMSGGRLQINLLPAGAVVGALEIQDAIIGGALDAGHGVTAYWYGKSKASSLFGTPPSFGWNANEMVGWMWYGGGQELYEELVQDILGLNLGGFLYGPMPTQAFGWFREPIREVGELSGLRYRTVGLAADLFEELGAAVTILGGPDIVPALDRGVIDAAEFNNPSSDRVLGFYDVASNWYHQSYHQDCEAFEITLNKANVDGLPEELQAILRYAAYAVSSDMYWKAQVRYPADYEWLETEGGVTMHLTPQEILDAQLDAWDAVIEDSAEDEFFARVIDSQKDFAQKAVAYHLIATTPKEPAYRHFFGELPLSRDA